MTTAKTKVVFRVWDDTQDVIALFPREAADTSKPWLCESYMHVGQHSSADPFMLIVVTRLAKPHEYRELAQELRGIGYKLQIAKRCTRADYEERKRQLEVRP